MTKRPVGKDEIQILRDEVTNSQIALDDVATSVAQVSRQVVQCKARLDVAKRRLNTASMTSEIIEQEVSILPSQGEFGLVYLTRGAT